MFKCTTAYSRNTELQRELYFDAHCTFQLALMTLWIIIIIEINN